MQQEPYGASFSPDGRWWWVQPLESHAARLSVGFDGADLLNFTVGNIWFEIFPIESVDEHVCCARQVALAVFRLGSLPGPHRGSRGRIEEAGFRGDAYGRIFLDDERPLSVGRVHHPWPWHRGPFKRHYQPYAKPLTWEN